MNELVARARGLQGRLTDEAARTEVLSPDAAEALARGRIISDFQMLARWATRDELAVLELDEDRRSLRAIVRGMAARAPAERRRVATVPTSRLSERTLERLVSVASIGELSRELAAIDHPLRGAFDKDATTIDIYALELALARTFAGAARQLTTDHAMIVYLGDLLDAAARRIDEDAALAAQLASQRVLRRTMPHGMAPVIYAVLTRRAQVRQLRRAAWQHAFGGSR